MTRPDDSNPTLRAPTDEETWDDGADCYAPEAYAVEFLAVDEILLDTPGLQEPLELHDFFQLEDAETGTGD
jgi:hypothetical protein